MRSLVRAGIFLLASCASSAASAQETIPTPLQDWQRWVLHGEEYRRCPFLSSTPNDADEPWTRMHFAVSGRSGWC